jgi:hypothetical protein
MGHVGKRIGCDGLQGTPCPPVGKVYVCGTAIEVRRRVYHDEHDGEHDLNALVSLIGRVHTAPRHRVVIIPEARALGREVAHHDELFEVITGCGATFVGVTDRK